ncbi:P-loop containing nucleoside triphosphate hydrolase protein [Bisporella sp. PMI_857]|nr:P-loop containing nucleoside triphosphate hydrolase protein [Bisporella sp. PMI_857]
MNSIILRRNVYPDASGRKPELQLEIQSNLLCEVFRNIAPHLSTVDVHARPIIIKAPFHELYYFREEIMVSSPASQSNPARDLLRQELKELTKFIDETFSQGMSAEINALKASRKVSMEYLWSIFKPGDMVLLRQDGPGGQIETCCGVLQSYHTMTSNDGTTVWCLKIRHMSFEGGKFGVVENNHQFQLFSGQMEISNLPAFPLAYCPTFENIKEGLLNQGKKYVQLCVDNDGKNFPVHMAYSGPVWVQKERWKIDGCGFFDAPERPVCHFICLNSAKISEFNPNNLSVEELMTFPSRIAGYSLVTKDAGYFQVNGFRPIIWGMESADNYRKSSQKMQTIVKIVSGFSFQNSQFGYENKGAGLTFLFYGNPGVGKTLTAECVAEVLNLPLYRVSGSDIGEGTWSAEHHLMQAFSRSTRWKAVLLFDEADAFMAKRSDDSLERNAMVAALLRLIEYQSGIVILTTNRISEFDTAFHSRIHVTIEYGPLTLKEKMEIWRSAIGERAHVISEADFEMLSQLDLDGRTIRNVVHVLKLFAGTENKNPFSLSDVKQVLGITTGNAQGEAKKQVEAFCRA